MTRRPTRRTRTRVRRARRRHGLLATLAAAWRELLAGLRGKHHQPAPAVAYLAPRTHHDELDEPDERDLLELDDTNPHPTEPHRC